MSPFERYKNSKTPFYFGSGFASTFIVAGVFLTIFTPWQQLSAWIFLLGVVIGVGLLCVWAFHKPELETDESPEEFDVVETEQSDTAQLEIVSAIHVPPRPSRDPIFVQPQGELSDQHEANETSETAIYEHRPKPVLAIFYSAIAGFAILGLLLATIAVYANTGNVGLWYFFAACAVLGITLCYWEWLIWKGILLIIGPNTKQLQRNRPWPLKSDAPSMPTKSNAAQNVEQTFVDRLLGTCRLYSDVMATGDEVFQNLKWLPYPDELRAALGQAPMKKISWWIFKKTS